MFGKQSLFENPESTQGDREAAKRYALLIVGPEPVGATLDAREKYWDEYYWYFYEHLDNLYDDFLGEDEKSFLENLYSLETQKHAMKFLSSVNR